MRWTIEVSASQATLSAGAEPLVVEAKSWQAALQVARAVDPTAGPISQLSIELTADGYQATDPATKARYLIKKTAPDTPLRLPVPASEVAPSGAAPSGDAPAGEGSPSGGPAPSGGAAPSTLPTGVSPPAAGAPATAVTPVAETPAPVAAAGAPAPVAEAPAPVETPAPAPEPVPRSEMPTRPDAPISAENAARAESAPAPSVDSMEAPERREAPAPTPVSVRPEAAPPVEALPAAAPPVAEPVTAAAPSAAPSAAPLAVESPAPAAPASVPPVSASPASAPALVPQPVVMLDPDAVPPYQVVLSREEQPSDKSPLTYREVVYAVPTGTPEANAERLVRKLWSEIAQQLWASPPGKFINLAIFDVVFTGRPPRPPLVTLTWKDWRGPEPELAYPMRQRTSLRPAGPASMPPPAVQIEASRVPTLDPILGRPMISLETPSVASGPPGSILPATQSVPPSALPDGGRAHHASESLAPVSAVRPVEPTEAAPVTGGPTRASLPPETAPSRTESATSRAGDEIPTSLPHVEVSPISVEIDVDLATPGPSAVADASREAPPASTSSMVLPEPPPEKDWTSRAATGDAAPASAGSPATERGANPAATPAPAADEPSAVVPVVVLAEVATVAAPKPAAEIEGSAPAVTADAAVPSTEPAASRVPSTAPAESSPTQRGEALAASGVSAPVVASAEAPRVVSAAEAALTGAPVASTPEEATADTAPAAVADTAAAADTAPAAEVPVVAAKGAAVADPFADPFAAPKRDEGPRVDARGKKVKDGARRLSGDDLLGDLFEAMHEVHFQANTLEAAHFVLWLAVEKMPCRGAVCHFFDINRREFVVVHALGDRRPALLLKRSPEREPLISQVMRTRRARVVAGGDPLLSGERWTAGGPMVHSAVVAPVSLGGRFLGLLELIDPVDGGEFTESDGYALAYIGEQFAEFLGQRGVMIEPEAIATFQPPKMS